MARMPGATWRPIPINYTNNGQSSVRGVVVHIMAGTLSGTDSWFRNSAAKASSHFGTGKAGTLYQWVDTADRAWAQAAGNTSWLSVENEGKGGDKLTDAQLDRNAEVLAWAHERYGVPLQVASGPSGYGLGYHAMGGSAWGGHTSCPGPKIVAQLAEIVARAKKIAGGHSPAEPSGPARYQVTINGLPYGYGAEGSHVTKVGEALVRKGFGKHYKSGPGPKWSDADTENYSDYQVSLKLSGADADGVPGESSLKRLLGTLPGKAKPSTPAKPYVPPAFPSGLAPGKSKPSAKALQRVLKATGFMPASVKEADNYGPQTSAAVARFHNAHPSYRAKGKTYDPAIGARGWAYLHRLAH
ncbi:peptidoglycan-binding protein [Streptomyces sp. NPDC052069]|uniref:peptidoglycan-binding protein n=1 Tax=Streptomyces sp. NPDC052069 TaxID=3154650 RepID=UPI003424A796